VKKPTLAFICVAFLLAFLVVPVHSSVSVEGTVGDNIYVIYNFVNLNSIVYDETRANSQFNSTTIPRIIARNLERQNLTQVNYGFQPNIYNDASKTIRVSFYLGGSDIISFTVNRTTLRRTYQVKTGWRRFQVNLTSSFSVNFAQYFAERVEKWQNPNPTTYSIVIHETGFFDVLSFNLTLPTTATNAQASGDNITYEVPPYFEDVLLGSPFLILAVLIIIIAIFLIYRKVK